MPQKMATPSSSRLMSKEPGNGKLNTYRISTASEKSVW